MPNFSITVACRICQRFGEVSLQSSTFEIGAEKAENFAEIGFLKKNWEFLEF